METKRSEVAIAKASIPLDELRAQIATAAPPRPFAGNIRADPPYGIHLIAETKQRSPSAGILRDPYDPVAIAREYHAAGASAISVLTDATYFGGALEHIRLVKEATPLPVLRKDFIVDEYQIYESRAAGADAVLLIAEVLPMSDILHLAGIATTLDMSNLIEVHSEKNCSALMQSIDSPWPDNCLLGINNRDLTIQQTNIATTAKLAAIVPGLVPIVSESGIKSRDDVLKVMNAGARAILVGESFLGASSATALIHQFLGK